MLLDHQQKNQPARVGQGRSSEAVVESIYGQPIGDRAVLARAARVEGVFGLEACMLGDEAWLGCDQRGVFGGAAFDVGLNEERAARDENAAKLRQ